jgi:hypothetical protein
MRTTLVACLLLTACTDDGTPPEISALTYTPDTVTVGVASTVTGSIAFDDVDGDLSRLNVELIGPDSQLHSIPSANITALGDLKTGTLPFQMVFGPPTAGDYTFNIWISDDAGNDSNKLDGLLTVE